VDQWSLDCLGKKMATMAFDPRRAFNIEAAGIATVILSIAVAACNQLLNGRLKQIGKERQS
jgi:hypothetical protein